MCELAMFGDRAGWMQSRINMSERAKEMFKVLVADDSANDRFLLRSAMQRATRLQIIAEVSDGVEAISYLSRQAEAPEKAATAAPDLLLLDLKMPKRDGFEVLEWLRTQTLSGLSVVVLTNSMEPDHLRRALDLGADFFQVKPRSQKDCVSMVLALEERLIQGAQMALPRHDSHPAHSSAASRHAHIS